MALHRSPHHLVSASLAHLRNHPSSSSSSSWSIVCGGCHVSNSTITTSMMQLHKNLHNHTRIDHFLTSMENLTKIVKRSFIKFPNLIPSSGGKSNGDNDNIIKYYFSKVVNFTPQQLYSVVEDIPQYHHFVPNCFDSRIIRRLSPTSLRACLTVGIPNVISEDYISTVQLFKPERIVIRCDANKFTHYLHSEWRFTPVKTKNKYQRSSSSTATATTNNIPQTLVEYEVQFEVRSALTAALVKTVFDNFAHRTAEAFLSQTQLIYSQQTQAQKQQQQQEKDNNKIDETTTTSQQHHR